jgi:sigma-B regulation protein RsbU (phosphoserine phosphatase)
MNNPEEQVRRYGLLLEAACHMGSVMDLDDLISQLLDRAKEVMQAEACSIFLPDPLTGDLILVSTNQVVRCLDSSPRVPAGKGIAGAVFQSRKSINITDASRDSRLYDRFEHRFGIVTRALLTVPLLHGEDCLGVMQVLNPTQTDCFTEECERIFEAFAVLVVSALHQLDVKKQEMERARNRQEISFAREIQESFLPPSHQCFRPCRVHMKAFPARNVGGDFYFLHEIAPDCLLMGLGDVAGKGIPAALTMARSTAMIKARVDQLDTNFADWIRLLNRQISEDLRFGAFIGMTLLLADANRGEIKICSAGQFAPIHYSKGKWSVADGLRQPPLGILPSFAYQVETHPLHPGEYWMLISDGIVEARNRANEELTLERFVEALPSHQTGSKAFAAAIALWRDFVGVAAPHDDASILLLDWRGASPAANCELNCCPETLCSGRQFVEGWATFAGYDDLTVGQIVSACDEAASNVFRHAYGSQPGPMAIHAEIAQDSLVFTIRDKAPPINPALIQGRKLDDLAPGGLGTVILNASFDTVNYQPLPDGNRLILKKRLPYESLEGIGRHQGAEPGQ